MVQFGHFSTLVDLGRVPSGPKSYQGSPGKSTYDVMGPVLMWGVTSTTTSIFFFVLVLQFSSNAVDELLAVAYRFLPRPRGGSRREEHFEPEREREREERERAPIKNTTINHIRESETERRFARCGK